MKRPSLEEVLKDIHEYEFEKWLVIARKDPRLAAMKIALYMYDEHVKKLNEDELIKKWRRIKNGQE